MTTIAANSTKKKTPDSPSEDIQSARETIESIVVAFILAFLFRAFVAEAFVIPTGSMAPTLMGAHKDTVCEHCGKQYQASASNEFDSNTGSKTDYLVVASTCPTCRGLNAYDLANNANHASFSGDRILVSKFDYVLHNPQRWDVIVFKYPLNARMNYIKRLVGLPSEHLLVKGGDVYVRKSEAEAWSIARKPPHKIRAMRQTVSDTKFQPQELIAAGWPSLWQPSPSEQMAATNWKVAQEKNTWSAELTPSTSTEWLRYYHKFLTSAQWKSFETTKQLPTTINPLGSRLITDYQAYNTSYITNRGSVYDPTGKLRKEFDGNMRPYFHLEPYQVSSDRKSHSQVPPQNDSEQWVSDLAGDFDVNVTSSTGTLSVLLVEFGIEFRCDIDIATGKATLQAMDGGEAVAIFTGGDSTETTQLTADTSIRGTGSHRLEIANFDDQIVVWANGSVVQFDQPTTFNFESRRSDIERRPYWTTENPLDAAPVAIGGSGLAMRVDRAKVWRDIYYIAISKDPYSDFPLDREDYLVASIPSEAGRAEAKKQSDSSHAAISSTYEHPEWWSESNLFSMRNQRKYALADDHYFPMGDNSAQSADARAWYDEHGDHNYVEQRFMLGKALLVFWPHYWNRPIPFFPNFSRMGLIR